MGGVLSVNSQEDDESMLQHEKPITKSCFKRTVVAILSATDLKDAEIQITFTVGCESELPSGREFNPCDEIMVFP
jgi:hypothetical protein